MKKSSSLLFVLFVGVFLSACMPSPEVQATRTAKALTATATLWTLTPTSTVTLTPTLTPTNTSTATITLTPTVTDTPTVTNTPTITPSPTFSFPTAVINKQAHCRYGPSIAYLHAEDVYAGDTGTVRGTYPNSRWLLLKLDKNDKWCWVAPTVVDVTGDIKTLYEATLNLQRIGFNIYGPPKDVSATRDGNIVTITWARKKMTLDDDRGYFIEAWVCQNGQLTWWTVSFPDQYTTTYSVQDDYGCNSPSKGEILTVEKHGYSDPTIIPWPPALP